MTQLTQKMAPKYLVMICWLLIGFKVDGWHNDLTKFRCPLKNGTIVNYKVHSIRGHPNRSIEIMGPDSNVLSASTGIVSKILNDGSSFYIIIKTDSFFFGYSKIDSLFVREKDHVVAGERIGMSRNKEIELIVATNTMIVYDPRKLLNCRCLVQ